jgi:hypothetical protein
MNISKDATGLPMTLVVHKHLICRVVIIHTLVICTLYSSNNLDLQLKSAIYICVSLSIYNNGIHAVILYIDHFVCTTT